MHVDALHAVYRMDAVPRELLIPKRKLRAARLIRAIYDPPADLSSIYHGKDPSDFLIDSPVVVEDDINAVLLWSVAPDPCGLRGETGYLQMQRMPANAATRVQGTSRTAVALRERAEVLSHGLILNWGHMKDVRYPDRIPTEFTAGIAHFGTYVIDPDTGVTLSATRDSEALNAMMEDDSSGLWIPLTEPRAQYDKRLIHGVMSLVVRAIHKYAYSACQCGS